MQSWLMKLWLNHHNEDEWPDLSLCQPEDACHVKKEEDRPCRADIEKMCSDGFFTEHEYQYAAVNGMEATDCYEILPLERATQRPLPTPPTLCLAKEKTKEDQYQIVPLEMEEEEEEEAYDTIPLAPCTSGFTKESTIPSSALETTDGYEMLSEVRAARRPLPTPRNTSMSGKDATRDQNKKVPHKIEDEENRVKMPHALTCGFVNKEEKAKWRPSPTPRMLNRAVCIKDTNVTCEMKQEGEQAMSKSSNNQHEAQPVPKPLPRTIRFV